jgi:hypothetical protein
MDKRAYRAASSRMRLSRLERAADVLAKIYIHGYECGLRGQTGSVWLEGTREMKRVFEIGNAAGLRRKAAAQNDGDAWLNDEISPEADYAVRLDSARRVV